MSHSVTPGGIATGSGTPESELSPSSDPRAGAKRVVTATGLSVLTAVTAVLVVVAVTH